MKKNKMMRLASCLMVLVMLTTCMISGTFAKYTTSVESQDSARVAKWGFEPVAMNITGLFDAVYGTSVASENGDDVIAPGTFGSAQFAFAYDEANGINAPEVAYTFSIEVDAECDELIKANKNIIWSLDGTPCGSWDEMIAAIKLLSGEADGTKEYAPQQLPTAFGIGAAAHTISWEWVYDGGSATYDVDNDPSTPALTQDEYDTYMGNADVLDKCSIKITVSATQID